MLRTPSRRRHSAAAAALATAGVLVAGVIAGFASAAASPAQTAQAADSALVNGYRNVGYFTQWGVYGRDFKLKKLQDSGAAADLTHINYAFGNIHHQTLTCFEANKAQGTGPNGSDGAGDAWADYGMGYTTANSVAGVADTWDQPLAGSFNQLKQLKARNPGLKAMISLGGWTWSKNFSKAAATDATRETFVRSCIDLYIKGNLPVIDGRGGPGSAAGVFDGIDIDWEWPGSNNGLEGNHVDTVNDKRNFRLLLAEFREQLDAYGASVGKKFELSAFLPANPADITAGGWNDPANFASLDFGNIQGYDFWGGWAPNLAGHQGNLYPDPADPRPASQRYSVDASVQAYLGAGIPAKQLGIGLAAYGRGWQGVAAGNSNGAWQSATGVAPGTWEAGNEDYDKLKTRGTDYYNSAIGAAWRYDGNQWWTYDNVQTVNQKGAYVASKRLGGGMWWDLSGNHDGTLMKTLARKFDASPTGPVTDGGNPTTPPPSTTPPPTTQPPTTPPPTTQPPSACSGVAAWSATAVYTGTQRASYQSKVWEAKWWTQGDTPSSNSDGPWKLIGNCDGSTPPPTTPPPAGSCVGAWSLTAVYVAGNTVSYQGKNWTAAWWTQNNTPGAEVDGPWKSPTSCT